MRSNNCRNAAIGVLLLLLLDGGACLKPAPKLAHFPPQGVALRVDVFGAQAEQARSMFESVRNSNRGLSFVKELADGEVLVGLEQSTVPCVEPTAYCEFRVAMRVRNPAGSVVHAAQTTVGASGDSCYRICDQALQNVATLAVSKAAELLKGESAGAVEVSKSRRKEPLMCGVGVGPRLPSDEVERRISQVDALKRQGILDPDEFGCLRKSLLTRL
jgi:hypothetical protein